MDLITPNRLLLGRNNQRSPDGFAVECDNPTKILKENEKVYNAWFEVWLLVHVPKLMKQQKWFDSDGDDKLPRKARVRYRNSSEDVFRETYRSVRSLVIIHQVNDSDIMTELATMAKNIDFKSII